MAANGLAVPYSELKDVAARKMGWNRTTGSWTSVQTADFGVALARALRYSYYRAVMTGERQPHYWSFLSQVQKMDLYAPYATGTITVSTTTCTLASGTWPSWAAAADIWIGGERYGVASRDSDSVLTLAESLTVASGTSYELIQHYYPMPQDFGSLLGDGFYYPRSSRIGQTGKLTRIADGALRRMDRDYYVTGYPDSFALSFVAPADASTDSRQQVQFFPITNGDRTLEYRYEVIPPKLDGSTYVYHHGGPWFSELLVANLEDQLCRIVRHSEECAGSVQAAIDAAVGYDRRTNAVDTLGHDSQCDPSMLEYLVYDNRRYIPPANNTTPW